MQVHPSGYYAWVKAPLSDRAKANKVLSVQIKEAYVQSNNAYGYRNIHKDLIESGIRKSQTCGTPDDFSRTLRRWNSQEKAPT
jgi:putative transposase